MQQRHQNRKQYFCELANTAREFYLDYLQPYLTLAPETRVLEIGCGEGGNLLPFAESGCSVTGIDISQCRIDQAQAFFAQRHQQGTFVCQDFTLVKEPKTDDARFDIILVHDVIEHIHPRLKRAFLSHINSFLKERGLVFFGFPAWHNPFGGHQQISVGFASKLPFIHLLPRPVYHALLKSSGATPDGIDELMNIRDARMSVEHFERMSEEAGFAVCRRTLWLINPHYKQKFHLKPRRLSAFFASIPYLRNFYTTSAWYLLRKARGAAQVAALPSARPARPLPPRAVARRRVPASS